ncbi:MAG: hypothetical protein WD066_13170 [Planctomycetaceae bacterium]
MTRDLNPIEEALDLAHRAERFAARLATDTDLTNYHAEGLITLHHALSRIEQAVCDSWTELEAEIGRRTNQAADTTL